MQPFQHNLQCPAAKHHARQATLTQPLQSDLRSLLYKSHYNCIDQGSNPQHGCSHYTAICTPELYFSMEDASERAPDPSHRQGSQPPEHSSSTAICNHCLANHTTTPSTKAAIHNMDAASTMRSARLNCTLQGRTRPSARQTRRTDKVPNIDAGSHFVRENIGFGAAQASS